MPRKKVSEEDIEKMKSLKREGHTYKEIAGEFDVSLSTVGKYLRGMGKRTKITPEIIERMKELRREDHTYEEIAEELDVSMPTVGKYMKRKELGRERREPSLFDRLKRKLGLE